MIVGVLIVGIAVNYLPYLNQIKSKHNKINEYRPACDQDYSTTRILQKTTRIIQLGHIRENSLKFTRVRLVLFKTRELGQVCNFESYFHHMLQSVQFRELF